MNHTEVRARLIGYLEGDLGLSERALVDAHLDGCEGCAGELAGLRMSVDLVRGLPDPEPPQDLVASVMARVRAGEGRPGWWAPLRRMPAAHASRPGRVWFPAAAAAAAAGLALWVAGPDLASLGSSPEARPQSVAVRPAPPGASLPLRPDVPGPPAAGAPEPPSSHVATLETESPAGPPGYGPLAGPSAPSAAPYPAHGPGPESPTTLAQAARPAPPSEGPAATALAPATRVAGAGSEGVGPTTAGPSAGNVVAIVAPEAVVAKPVANRPPEGEISAERQLRIDRTRDEYLSWIQAQPEAYLREYANYSPGERPNWVSSLAQRAAERGDLDAVVAALRGVDDPLGEEVAAAFEAAANGEAAGGNTP